MFVYVWWHTHTHTVAICRQSIYRQQQQQYVEVLHTRLRQWQGKWGAGTLLGTSTISSSFPADAFRHRRCRDAYVICTSLYHHQTTLCGSLSAIAELLAYKRTDVVSIFCRSVMLVKKLLVAHASAWGRLW